MKGLVERANDYLETSFLPGRLFNAQLTAWLQIALPIATRGALGRAPREPRHEMPRTLLALVDVTHG